MLFCAGNCATSRASSLNEVQGLHSVAGHWFAHRLPQQSGAAVLWGSGRTAPRVRCQVQLQAQQQPQSVVWAHAALQPPSTCWRPPLTPTTMEQKAACASSAASHSLFTMDISRKETAHQMPAVPLADHAYDLKSQETSRGSTASEALLAPCVLLSVCTKPTNSCTSTLHTSNVVRPCGRPSRLANSKAPCQCMDNKYYLQARPSSCYFWFSSC